MTCDGSLQSIKAENILGSLSSRLIFFVARHQSIILDLDKVRLVFFQFLLNEKNVKQTICFCNLKTKKLFNYGKKIYNTSWVKKKYFYDKWWVQGIILRCLIYWQLVTYYCQPASQGTTDTLTQTNEILILIVPLRWPFLFFIFIIKNSVQN